ncbi:dTDP-L-oleandrosyltransferase [Actinokineospora baliensis]|uniref:macrolide family glycosyltransferase n=1 Tax=Actinokineospora baliensis TaxID=547056 RepID=UPI001959D55E|nr:macrolide family glycosyltransferase [Actinokineospora baliensis]MBM7769823.1 dTDP-L-oleandrosyltransferase [Actinokineospora baliensis]
MRVLHLNNSGFGHVIPSLGVVEELVRRGHEVTYVTAAGPVAKVEATGATVLPYESRLPGIDLSNYNTADETAALTGIYLTESEAILKAVDEHYKGAPDVICYDLTVYHAARVLGRQWDVPIAQCLPVFASNQHFSLLEKMVEKMGRAELTHPELQSFFRRLTALLAERGQADADLEDFIGRTEDLNLVYFPRSFQFAGDTFDDRFVFVGPGLAADPTRWTPPDNGKPLLFVSLGTCVNRRAGFFKACVDAFRDQPWHVVMAVHEGVDRAELGPIPANVEVHGWLPNLDVLAHTSVFLSHAGLGSVMGALSRDVPLVVVPSSPEDWVNARRVAELGLGRVIRDETPPPSRIRAAVLDVDRDKLTRERVGRMRADIEASGGGVAGADALETYVAKRGH